MPVGYQVIVRAEEDRVLAPDVAARRAVALTTLRVGKRLGLYVFGLPDTHLHVGIFGTERDAGRLAHDLPLALRAVRGLRLEARVRPIRDVWHAQNLHSYALGQAEHHGILRDPCAESTSLPDLLGLRPMGAFVAERVRAHLPRVTRSQLLAILGVRELAEGFDLAHLAAAGAAAVGAAELIGRGAEVVAARHACVHAAPGASARELAGALGVTARAIQKLRAEAPPDGALVRAVRLQMGLRASLPAAREPVFAAPDPRDGRAARVRASR